MKRLDIEDMSKMTRAELERHIVLGELAHENLLYTLHGLLDLFERQAAGLRGAPGLPPRSYGTEKEEFAAAIVDPVRSDNTTKGDNEVL